jgi:cytoskeletal protein RodZ
MSDNPLLKTPGEMINEAREAQDLTIAQLSELTKIPPPVLTSLELDEYHKISGPLYIKSFLRTCAGALDLDPQLVLSLYNKISGEREAGPVGSEMVWEEEEVTVSKVGLPWLQIIMAAGIVAIVVGLGLFALRGCGNGEPAQEEVSPEAGLGTATEETVAVVVPTEADPIQETEAPEEETYSGSRDEQVVESSLPDTLALGWIFTPEPPAEQEDSSDETGMVPEDPVQNKTVNVPPSVIVTTPEKMEPEELPSEEIPAEETQPEEPRQAMPVVAEMDSSWPLVLGISCTAAQEILVKRDGDREFSGVRWPAENKDAPELPATGFESGQAYRQGDRLVVFWGAEDHFSLKLARVRGVTVSINGRDWDVGRLKPGQELVLDAHSVGSTPRR